MVIEPERTNSKWYTTVDRTELINRYVTVPTARHGVERHAAASGATTDHEHVMLFVLQSLHQLVARRQRTVIAFLKQLLGGSRRIECALHMYTQSYKSDKKTSSYIRTRYKMLHSSSYTQFS